SRHASPCPVSSPWPSPRASRLQGDPPPRGLRLRGRAGDLAAVAGRRRRCAVARRPCPRRAPLSRWKSPSAFARVSTGFAPCSSCLLHPLYPPRPPGRRLERIGPVLGHAPDQAVAHLEE